MENEKETAVEWLYRAWELSAIGRREPLNLWDLERAINMEKQQIMDAYAQGVVDEAGEILDVTEDSEAYYKSKYVF